MARMAVSSLLGVRAETGTERVLIAVASGSTMGLEAAVSVGETGGTIMSAILRGNGIATGHDPSSKETTDPMDCILVGNIGCCSAPVVVNIGRWIAPDLPFP